MSGRVRSALRRWTMPLAMTVALVAAPAAGRAQQRPRGGPPREELEERVRARFAEMVKQRLGLTDQQEKKLTEVVMSFQGDRRDLARRERALHDRIDSLHLGSDAPSAPPGEAKAVLDEMMRLRERELELSRKEQDQLLKVLSPLQVLEFHQLREDMADRIRRARENRRGGPGRGGPPGGPPPGAGAPRPGPGGG